LASRDASIDSFISSSSKPPSRPKTFSSYAELSNAYNQTHKPATATYPDEYTPLGSITLGSSAMGSEDKTVRAVTRVEEADTAEEMMARATEATAKARAAAKAKADETRRAARAAAGMGGGTGGIGTVARGSAYGDADELPAFTSPFRSAAKKPFKSPEFNADPGGIRTGANGGLGRDGGSARASTSSRGSWGDGLGSDALASGDEISRLEISRLRKVVEEMTAERAALERAHARQNELMQQLADENETMTGRCNALTSELGTVNERLEHRENEVIAQGAVVRQLAAERDAAIKRATHAMESARVSSIESVELEERCRSLKMETMKTRHELENIRDEAERTDRALRAAAADRGEMQTSLNAMQDERMHLQSALRRMAAKEEAEMERGAAEWNGEAPENTPNPTPQKTRDASAAKRAARLADELGAAFDGVGGRNSSSNGDGSRVLDGDAASGTGVQSQGVFSHMSRSMNGVPLGGVPVEKVGEDQLRLVDSIHALLTEVEDERSRARAALAASKRKMDELHARNVELEKRLGHTVQRLELEVGKELGAKMREASEDEARAEAIDGGEYEYAEDGARVYTASDGTKHYVYNEDTPRAGGILNYLNPFGRRR
jgi:hypothetical protein